MPPNHERHRLVTARGTRYTEIEGNPMLQRGRELFAIKNRSFGEVDGYFAGSLTREIHAALSRRPDRPVRVLDVGGGTESVALRGLRIQFGSQIQGVNADIAHDPAVQTGASRLLTDVRRLPLRDGSVDVAYSRQVFPFLDRFRRSHNATVDGSLAEVARVLAPNGVALIDDEEERSRPKAAPQRKQLGARLGVAVEAGESANPVQFRGFPNVLSRQTRPQNYLVMRKPNNI